MPRFRLYFIKRLLNRIKSQADFNNMQFARREFERVGRFNKPLSGFKYVAEKIGDIKTEWVIPDGADDKKVLLYFHGGGYATGSINTHRSLISQIVRNAGITALSVEYRLSPENKFPAAVEDAFAAYQWLLSKGYLPENICLGGDSAGGGLTLATLLYIRDKNTALPKCAIALSPWTDHTFSGNSYQSNRLADPMLVAEGFPVWSKHYTGDEDPKNPYISPLFADLHNLPSIYIQVGEHELLLDDSTRFAAKAKEAGVDITLDIFPEMFHVFQAFWRILPTARNANKQLGAFLKKQLASK